MDKTDRLRDYGLAFLLYEHGLGICGYELIRELFIVFIKLILNSYLVYDFFIIVSYYYYFFLSSLYDRQLFIFSFVVVFRKRGRHWLAHPLVIHIITPLQGSNIELRFAANYNLPLCVIGHFKLFSYRCSNICIFCHQAKS